MNVYDFDKTIFVKDSSIAFYLYVLKKDLSVIRYLPRQLHGLFLYAILKRIDKTELKEYLYVYFQSIENIDKEIEEFWTINKCGIKKWYEEQKEEDDIVISASPLFLVQPICNRLGIKKVYGSIVDKKTGKPLAPNCHGDEKVNTLLRNSVSLKDIEDFYSDSHDDDPMAKIAKRAFFVSGNRIERWKF